MKVTKKQSLRVVVWIAISLMWTLLSGIARAQGIATTTVQGTVYLANGQPGSGTLQVSWPTFTTANSQAVTAGRTNLTIGADGYISLKLAPNQGATPAGLYYTAVYHLSDGSTSTEYWIVPAAAQASLSQIRAQVMPAAQAVQAVSKTYVDQSIQELTQSLLTASGGSLSGPLFLNGDPAQPTQAANKHYVDTVFSMAVPITGGKLTGPLTSVKLGAAYQVDQFPGVDFGVKLQACLNTLDPAYGGTCDARNFTGTQSIGSDLVISTANATVQLPCATISTSNHIQITGGTRNVTLHGCSLRGASSASGSQGGTVFLYSGSGPMMQIGDPVYATDTRGFHIDNAVMNTTASTDPSAQGLAAYRTQEMDLASLYFLGNSNQTGITLDGTGNYTGGTFQDIELGGYGTAVNAVGHQAPNSAITDWVNASAFLRLHINCPTSGGSPIPGTYGINLQQGDGNTFTGGDVEGCSTAMHLGPNAQNNTIVGLRNENSTYQVVADAGSSYNNWITGGTMFTGQLTDNGTRNSFLDTFHRSFNGLNGDWYGSQKDATVTNHFRIGTGAGNERGLLNRYQTDFGYRWTTGLSDASAGEQFYQILDELNNVYRLSIGQYNNGQSSANNQTVINAAGTGAIVLNGSSNAGTGGVLFGAGGANAGTVASINNAGNAQFNGSLAVGGSSTFTNSTTVKNQADAEIDSFLWAGATANQKESYTYKDYTGASQWYMVKDANNNWALNSATGGLDSFKAYQNTNSGDTYINASNSTGHIRLNYESGSGAETDIYSGSSGSLVAAFLGTNAIKLPGLASSSGRNCLQIDNSGYISNTGLACGGLNGTVNSGTAGQVAYYTGNGTAIAGTTAVGVTAGGTGATSAAQALANLGAQLAISGLTSDGASGIALTGGVAATAIGNSYYASRYPGQSNTGIAQSFADSTRCGTNGCTVIADPGYASTEQPYTYNQWGNMNFPPASMVHFIDQRKGAQTDLYRDPPVSGFTGHNDFHMEGCASNNLQGYTGGGWTGWTSTQHNCHTILYWMGMPGMNLGTTNGSHGEHGPGGWSIHLGLTVNGVVNSPGIEQPFGINVSHAGVGDGAGMYLYHYNYGGAVAGSDEGNSLMSSLGGEAGTTYAGTIATGGGGTGATSIKVACTSDCNAAGDGRYLVDLTRGVSGNATAYTNPSDLYTPGTFTTDISVTPSTFWGTLNADVKTPVTPVGGTLGVTPSSMTFVVNSGSGNTGSPTVGDLVCFGGSFHEQSKITAVSGTGPWTVTVPLLHAHEASSWIMANGPCGNFIDFTANDVPGTGQTLRYPVDILGATDAHTLQYRYFRHTTPTVYFPGNVRWAGSTYGGLTNVGGVVTFYNVWQTSQPWLFNIPTVTISGADNPTFNGPCTNTIADSSSYGKLTCTQAASTGQTATSAKVSAGSSPYGNTAFNLYPGAEILDVQDYNATSCAAAGKTAPCMDGALTLEPNAVAWTTGDSVENSHHYSTLIHSKHDTLYVYNPNNYATWGNELSLVGAGVGGGNTNNPTANFAGQYINNFNGASSYMYHGGYLTPPGGFALSGIFNYGLWMGNAPDPVGASVAWVGCPVSGCTDSTFYYHPLYLKGNCADGYLRWTPYSKTWTWGGYNMDFSSMNIKNLVYPMGASGSGHAAGMVPDPGSSAGTGRFLREDATWATVATNVFGASGASHSTGVVPDPGSSAGTTRFLREDATFAAPPVPAAFGASGAGHSSGSVPDPGASAGAVKFLREDATFAVPSVGAPPVPANLQYLGDGSDGAYTCTSGNCSNTTVGEQWFSSFNVSVGATATFTGGNRYGAIIRVTGTCTIAGTLSAKGVETFGGENYGGGGGGGGGGTGAGTTGGSSWGPNLNAAGGSAGGGTGTTGWGLPTSYQRLLIVNDYPGSILSQSNNTGVGGALGGAGGSSGGAGGYGGGFIELICATINFTGTIDVGGAAGGNSAGNNAGAGGGGGGGILVMRSPALTNSGTINVNGGAGGTCGAFTGCGAGGAGGTGWSYIFSN